MATARDHDALVQRVMVAQERDRRACQQSPHRFVTMRTQIEEPDGSVIPFALWPFQVVTLQRLHDDPLLIVLKARRLGLSWLVLAYALWLAIYQPGSRILMLCKRLDDAKEMVGRLRRMHQRMATDPSAYHLVEGLKVGRDATDRFDLGPSVFRALPATPAAARSETAALWIWDEAAFVEDAGSIMQGALPTIEGGGRAVIVSTGNGETGMGAEFARQWHRAKAHDSRWKPLFWPWMVRPGRDEAWHRETLADLGDPDRFRTEYPQSEEDAFHRADALYVFTAAVLAAGHATQLRESGSGPQAGDRRFGVDVAREGKDRTTIYRYDEGVVRQQLVMHGAHTLMDVVGAVRHEMWKTGITRVVVDATGMGAGVVDRLRETGADAVEFYGGDKAVQPRRFVNRRAEVAWTMRQLMLDGALDVDPDDHVLAAELGLLAYGYDSAGRIALESKKLLLSKGLPSPDCADAAMMAACGDRIPSMKPFIAAFDTAQKTTSLTADLMERPM